ncbi:ATP pyrophosphatase [Candidatus Bathyarchaeota archaeon]|nr:ATP pyrophosphatase [Candidatus Bathyarchaeota archaeon]
MLAASLFSGGKESVHAISAVENQGVEVKHLLHEIPTFDSPHAHNIEALETLAKSMNKHFTIVDLRNGERELVDSLKKLNVDALVAGDINVPQHIKWLKNICSQAGIELLEPLFGMKTSILFREMFSQPRFKATIIGVNTKYLTEEWLGFTISSKTAEEFLSRTRHIDPLGENGEFHTIVVESPLYSSAFKIKPLERITEKDMTYLRLTLSE